MDRYVCIHGHFYQPPRENPWLEAIELQDSAYPYHDWNERIAAECYSPNGMSRILDSQDRIVRIVNNYAKISFNFGPTLLGWLKDKAPETYQTVLEADRESQKAFGGHGSAIAQAYNHMVLPLANRRDKYTQVVWGIEDFERHFGRAPEGMWLPETAVDLETLDILAELGIKFTILTPFQANRVRRHEGRFWRDVSGGLIDTTMPYEVCLPSGRSIGVFFYDPGISGRVAFGGLLASGERFAEQLLGAFSDARPGPQLVHIATDGETYGHHHRFGDMALAYALHRIESTGVRLTNYGEYLEKHPPTHEVEIVENTSWSCAHGIERWRSDCGCSTGSPSGGDQKWRAPLRDAFDWLRDSIAPLFEKRARAFFKDPWAARDEYIAVILDRTPESVDRFLAAHARHKLSKDEESSVLKLLELQRHAMLMYTSCGWFFADVSGIETVQVLQYAGRVAQLAQDLFGGDWEAGLLRRLEAAKSNVPERGDACDIYNRFVRPTILDWEKIGAYYAVSSLFHAYPEDASIYCYTFHRQDVQRSEDGRRKLAVGRVKVASMVTRETAALEFGALYSGGHSIQTGVRKSEGEESYQGLVQALTATFQSNQSETLRPIEKHFAESTYSLKSLFRDEQRAVLEQIMNAARLDAETAQRELYREYSSLPRLLVELNMPETDLAIPPPKSLQAAVESVLNADLQHALQEDVPNMERVRALLREAQLWGVSLDGPAVSHALKQTAGRLADRLAAMPEDIVLLRALDTLVEIARSSSFDVDLWRVQNVYYKLLHSLNGHLRVEGKQGDLSAHEWDRRFVALGEKLMVRADRS